MTTDESDQTAAAYQALAQADAAPLWRYYGALFPAEPKSKGVPHVWRYAELRAPLLHFAETLSLQDAERRVLMLINPGLQETAATVNTLYAGIQIITPDEDAQAHRHVSGAFRLIIEGEGAVTTVNGERVWMRPGDLLMTPPWHWHDHRHEGKGPMIWLDGLDYPLVNMLEAGFFESYHQRLQRSVVPDDLSSRQFIHGQLVPEWEERKGLNTPIGKYPWVETEAAFRAIGDDATGTDTDGMLLQYTNPWDGGPVMPTMACYVQRLPRGFDGVAHRHSTNTIYHVRRGHGKTIVEGQELDWGEKDVFVVPTWAVHRHVNLDAGDAILFSYSDEPVMRRLGFFREELCSDELR